jgi:hypothetical protein
LLNAINTRGGILFTVPSADADQIVFRLNVSASPRNPLYEGTDLPVVRERDFRRSKITLPAVNFSPGIRPSRARLRVYDPDAHPGATVRVTLREWNDLRQSLYSATQLFLLDPTDVEVAPGGIPPSASTPVPSYAEIDLQAVFPSAQGLVNVEVEPVTPDLRFWAFVTVTDNATPTIGPRPKREKKVVVAAAEDE